MLRNLEQALWYINMAAAVLLARLCAQGLVRVYPFLFAYLFADTLEQIVASAFAQRPHIYEEIYFVGQTVKVALTVFVILELYKLAHITVPATVAPSVTVGEFSGSLPAESGESL